MGLAGRAMGLTLDRVTQLRRRDRRRPPAARRGRRRPVLGAARRRRELRDRHRVRLRTRRVDRAAFFRIDYPRGAREEALADWDALAPRAPRALTAILTLDASGATAFGQYLGSEAALRRLIAPLGGVADAPAAPTT